MLELFLVIRYGWNLSKKSKLINSSEEAVLEVIIEKVIFYLWVLNNKSFLVVAGIGKLALFQSCVLQRYFMQDKIVLL